MLIQHPTTLSLAPLGAGTAFSVVEEVCRHFRFLGKFMAKAIMDSRMVILSGIGVSHCVYILFSLTCHSVRHSISGC